ncbi:hypothetical protein H6G41_15420 [Tolypothrix sp. FACHB-123]|uniref:hypothetical protein n=1 Tax=Tolypothrix sp. FACHB-123 TaxID=2692868 RepID=UPI0016837644|nr:hypothetical protein [Tolypothrix sp. FACHB-123]MBD2355995.1 hypothetical protein [Tolypothrix sp. FACHB-123]
MNNPEERLYKLLPAIYRIRDESVNHGTLRALLRVIEQELNQIETDIENLYENWFIETCDEWVVPYIGDLLDVKLYSKGFRTFGEERRAYIANTLALRSRKGTVPILEQLVFDTTGWRASVVENFQAIATTQNLNNPRLGAVTVNLRNLSQNAAKTIDIRRKSGQANAVNLGSINILIWRLKTYPIEKVTAKLANNQNQGQFYTFNPLGEDILLFNQPQTETEITSLAKPINLPGSLTSSKALITAELDAKREAIKQGIQPDDEGFFNYDAPVLEIFVDQQPIKPEEIFISDLSQWTIPNTNFQPKAIVDLQSGRLALTTATNPKTVEVSYSYAFSHNIGGGTYDRTKSLLNSISRTKSRITWDLDYATATDENPLLKAAKEWNEKVKIWQYCTELFYIPLHRLVRNPDNERIISTGYEAPKFQPGIINGLNVTAKVGENQVIIHRGNAVDFIGQNINLNINYRIDLQDYARQNKLQNQQKILIAILYKQAETEPRWEIQIGAYPIIDNIPPSVIPLTSLTIDTKGKILESDTNISPQFQPGVISGFTINFKVTPLLLSAGQAVNINGKLIELSNPTTIPNIPEGYTGENWLLYITPKAKIDIIQDEEMGVIIIRDNRTYEGDLTLNIPPDKHLQIVAADERRPHLLGNLSIKGTAKAKSNPGEFTINGLLIEGKLTVLPGNLQKLEIVHSTLVPNNGGIKVMKPDEDNQPITAEDDGFSLIAMIIYCLNLIHRIVDLGIGVDSDNSQNNLIRLFQLALRQVSRVFSFLETVLNQWQCTLPPINNEEEDEGKSFCDRTIPDETDSIVENNQNLSITIRESICGAIALADTVSYLEIADSIIDRGKQENPVVIAAPGTNTEIYRTTIFGITTVRSIETSNTIFTEKLTALRRQDGCLRFCYLPSGSRTPRRYRCQPDLALEKLREELEKQNQKLPAGIVALAVNPSNQQVFAGTEGNGILRFVNEQWLPLNQDTADKYITALFTYDNTLLAGTTDGGIFRLELHNGTATIQDHNININTDVTAFHRLSFNNQNYLFAATFGNGIFRLKENETTWNVTNTGLKNLNVITLAVDSNQGKIFAGTSGGGVFVSKNNGETWTALNYNLRNLQITALTINQNNGQIFVGTSGGGIYRWEADCEQWRRINKGLINPDITALVAYQKTASGTITLEDGKLIGQGTNFQEELGKGSIITIGNETRTVIDIEPSQQIIQIDSALINELPATGTTFTINYLIAGSSNGNIFRSQNNGDSWELNDINATYSDITSLAVQGTGQNLALFAGTAIGGVLQSTDDGISWLPVNQGLQNVTQKIVILTSIQPSFTSTDYGNPAYAQLSQNCASEISQGAEDGSEIGVFNVLEQPQRQASLEASLKEYLRFGITANIFYNT